MKIKLKKEVVDWMEETQSIYLDNNDEKVYLQIGAYKAVKDRDLVFDALELKLLPLFVKERICQMIGVEMVIKNEKL